MADHNIIIEMTISLGQQQYGQNCAGEQIALFSIIIENEDVNNFDRSEEKNSKKIWIFKLIEDHAWK